MNKKEKSRYITIIVLSILMLILAIIILTNTLVTEIIARPMLYPMPQDPVPMPPHKAPIPIGKVIADGLLSGVAIAFSVAAINASIRQLKSR